jgi:hypothetical protein
MNDTVTESKWERITFNCTKEQMEQSEQLMAQFRSSVLRQLLTMANSFGAKYGQMGYGALLDGKVKLVLDLEGETNGAKTGRS